MRPTNKGDREFKKSLCMDDTNRVFVRNGTPYVACGAKRVKHGGICKRRAGDGTEHPGRGRCKYHGGLSTGPRTSEGKQVVAQNPRKHGFYSDALSAEERAVYESQGKDSVVDLTHEIKILRAKLLTHLRKWQQKQEQGGEDATKVAYRAFSENEDGERISEIAGFYHAGGIEDRPLMKAFQDLSKMVERQARLNPDAAEDVLAQINAELRAASHGKVTLSWGDRKPAHRTETPE